MIYSTHHSKRELMSKTCTYPDCMRGCYGEFCLMHKPRKPIPQKGKYAKRWDDFRLDWLKRHKQATFICGICGLPVKREVVTLDHIRNRSANPELRYEDSNIQAAHLSCNLEKGSRSGWTKGGNRGKDGL